MTAETSADSLPALLLRLSALLDSADEPGWSARLSQLAGSMAEAGPPARQSRVREVLALYGGMGSFGDLVLQDRRGVLPEQPEFDRLRSELFASARAELG